jgi:hypothetical protein
MAATAAAVVGAAGATGALRPVATSSAATASRDRRGLRYRGVCYDVTDGEWPATRWDPVRMRADMWAIKSRLHADSVSVFGAGVDRLKATSLEAARRGLHVWLQPRLGDRPPKEILEHLAETGRHAEALRRQGVSVHLSVGAEFVLFVPGIVPGNNAVERIKNLISGHYDPVKMMRRLTAFTRAAAKVGRSVFKGRLTYGAAQDEEVDWSLFDLVSANYYSYFPRRSDYVRELARFRRWRKPVVISEFGTCTYTGAPKKGGMAWDVVDYTKSKPEIIGNLVRDERSQAAYIVDLLEVFESMNLYAALMYNFVTPDAPHLSNPRYDLDLASYSIVKAIWGKPDEPTSHWHWEPKQAFHALARHYRRYAEAQGVA